MRRRARRAVEEQDMPLLFWYLPYIIFSGAYESAMDSHDSEDASEAE
jgi:hypothetical protein